MGAYEVVAECSPSEFPGEGFPFGNFARRVSWSPDGRLLLVVGEDEKIRVFEAPEELLKETRPAGTLQLKKLTELTPGESLYDVAWDPNVRCHRNCRVALTGRDHSIRLWDLPSNGTIAGFRAHTACDELKNAYSLCFSPSSDTLIAGFADCFHIFDIGRYQSGEFNGKKVDVRGTKKYRQLPGIVSCITHHPDPSTRTILLGSFCGKLGVYDYRAESSFQFSLKGGKSGVTQVLWSPNPQYVFSGSRKSNQLTCWDVRYTKTSVFTMERDCHNSQRLQFDLDWSGRTLWTGCQTGKLKIFSTANGELLREHTFPHPVNSVSVNPSLPLVAIGFGTRHFPPVESAGESDDDIPALLPLQRATTFDVTTLDLDHEDDDEPEPRTQLPSQIPPTRARVAKAISQHVPGESTVFILQGEDVRTWHAQSHQHCEELRESLAQQKRDEEERWAKKRAADEERKKAAQSKTVEPPQKKQAV